MEERLMMPNVKKILAIAMLLVLFGFAIAIHTRTPAAADHRGQRVLGRRAVDARR